MHMAFFGLTYPWKGLLSSIEVPENQDSSRRIYDLRRGSTLIWQRIFSKQPERRQYHVSFSLQNRPLKRDKPNLGIGAIFVTLALVALVPLIKHILRCVGSLPPPV